MNEGRRFFASVAWFNADKGFGVAVTPTSSVPSELRRSHGLMEEVFLHISEMAVRFTPNSGDLIDFQRVKGGGKLTAKNFAPVDFGNEKTLENALMVPGDEGIIKGSVEVSRRRPPVRYDLNICATVLKNSLRAIGAGRVRETVRRHIESMAKDVWQSTIDAFLADKGVGSILRELYLPPEAFEVDDNDVVTALIQKTFVDRVIESKEFSELEKIPPWYGVTITPELAREFVEAASTDAEAERILSKFDKKTLANIYDPSDPTISWNRRILLSKVTQEGRWVCEYLENQDVQNNLDEVWQIEDVLTDGQIDIDQFLAPFLADDTLDERISAILFALTGREEFADKISDIPSLTSWLENQKAEHLLKFLKNYGLIADSDATSDPIVSGLSVEKIASAVRLVTEPERYSFLMMFPKTDVVRIVWKQFNDTPLFEQCISGIWNAEKNKVPCVVFDLESDGDSIREFAFRAEGNTRGGEGEDQLDMLKRALAAHSIVVGHNIKKWDLPILAKKGIATDAFVWDTLEVEILLNPCRYAYSLHAEHHAKPDAELTDRLFWDQLYRLSLCPDLCEQFAEMFPANINDILRKLQKPWFAEFFKRESKKTEDFFQTPGELDAKIVEQLDKINSTVGDKTALIVAPREIWGYIAQHVSVSFCEEAKDQQYCPLDICKIDAYTFDSPFDKAILKRYVNFVKTPIPANLAQYLRVNVFTEAVISSLVAPTGLKIHCTDADDLDVAFEKGPYDHVFKIGTELVNRLHQYHLPKEYDAADFIGEKCWIPMRLASTGFVAVSDEDRHRLKAFIGGEALSRAKNVWVERRGSGKYAIGYSMDFATALDAFVKSMPGVKIHDVPWNRASAVTKESFRLVTSACEDGDFDPREIRVTSVSPSKSAYWTYQFKLLESVKVASKGFPIVYVVDEADEVQQVRDLALARGYQVPPEIGLSSIQTWMRHRENALMALSRQDLPRFMALRSDIAFAVVFDRMSVEKCMMMWQGIAFGDEAKLSGASDAGTSGLHHGGTARDAMMSAWPIFAHYHRLVRANNGHSVVYLLDPYLDDYPELADSWHADVVASILWPDDKSYLADLARTQELIPSVALIPADISDDEIAAAMDTIREMLLPPDAAWHDYQIPVLREILSKKSDLVISIPTGGGKSVLFQGPALYQSMRTNRLSVVITPLKALMEDQIIGLREHGFTANVEYLNSDRSYFETRQIYRRIGGGDISLLYVTPERFRSKAFINAINRRIAADDGLEYFIFDEAHCVSQWGQEFRPDYLHVMDWCRELKAAHPATCTTFYSATMTGLIENDIRAYISGVKRVGLSEEDYNPIRDHISMSFREVGRADKEHYKVIKEFIEEKNVDAKQSRMLLFCLMRQQCENAAEALRLDLQKRLNRTDDDPLPVDYFHAGMEGDEREEMLKAYREGVTPFLCATKAFGMGIDISNIHYVVHYSPPRVLEDYLQEVGRAGRKKEQYEELGFGENNPLPAVCLYSRDDFRRHADRLKTGELTWSDLADLHGRILSFAKELQCLEGLQDAPIVIPMNFWSKGGEGDVTSLRLGLHWLERLRRIRLGFTRPACIRIDVQKDEFEDDRGSRTLFGARGIRGAVTNDRARAVYERVKQISVQRGNRHIQVQLSELRVRGKVAPRQVMDSLISCVQMGVLDIMQSVRCAVPVYRDSETRYVNEDEGRREHVALHWVFELARGALEIRRNGNGEIVVDAKRERDLLRSLREGSMSVLDGLHQTIDQNGTSVQKLPWYNKEDHMDNRGFVNPASYLDDFHKKRASRMYELLSLVPGVTVRTFSKKREVVHLVRNVDKKDAAEWLSQFEEDCWTLLEKIASWPSRSIKWVDLMKSCSLMDKGFEYFSSAMGFLSAMCYIETESLLPFGIEVFGTARTEDPVIEPTEGQDDFTVWKSFDEVASMRAVRLAAMAAFSRLHREQYDTFIQRYFQCASYESYMAFVQEYISTIKDKEVVDEIMSLLTDKVLNDEVGKLTDEQRAIYDAPLRTNINVLAGPGSGKTHVLTLRCARLIYKEGVAPDNILVLAYNRAVVVELKNRLERLFRGLGLSRRASQLHVHTFHSLAKRICGDAVSAENMSDWEEKLVQELRSNPQSAFARLSPTIQYVLIDEFQDITKTRLDAMDQLKQLYPGISFFTIGDKNQSIYGFERRAHGDPMSPESYYQRLVRDYMPTEYCLQVNFRSYQDILDAASRFIPQTNQRFLPRAAPQIMSGAPIGPHVEIIDNRISDPEKRNHWPRQFESVVREAKENGYSEVAVFFRTNAEVFRGFSRLRDRDLGDAVIRIQGTSGELWRSREVFSVIWYLRQKGRNPVVFKDELTRSDVRVAVKQLMDDHPNWDHFFLDLAFTLVLEALDGIEGEIGEFTYADLADIVKDTAERDDGQCYKIYARHKDGRIDQTNRLNIVLTTMHKVKGLEFDSVVITPSYAALPLNSDAPIGTPLTASDMEDVEEERRLLFVAYTRAKKKLRVYKWKREYAIEASQRMLRSDAKLGYRDKEDLDKLFLSYLARSSTFQINEYVANRLSRNEPLTLEACSNNRGALRYVVKHVDKIVACLSGNSKIVRNVEAEYFQQAKPNLIGVFVSDIMVWTYEDTLRYDRLHSTDRNPSNFASYWCEAAKQKGYVYVVDFAGYAKAPHPPTDPFAAGKTIPISGMNFRVNAMATSQLIAGSTVRFVRDPQSQYGADSVNAIDAHGRTIGFVARTVSPALSRCLASGRTIVARFEGSISEGNYGSTVLTIS